MQRISLPAGTRVVHRVFGEGTVIGDFLDQDGSQGRVLIEWDYQSIEGVKWWYWDFLGVCELEIISTFGP